MTVSIASASGIVCGKCSHGFGRDRVIVRHVSIDAIRHCSSGNVKAAAHLDRMEEAHVVKIKSLPPVPGAPVPSPADMLAEVDASIVRQARNVDPESIVPAGRYALRRGSSVKFYVVDRPETGRWAGFTFVSVQASDDLHRIRNRAERMTILSAISLDPAAASRLYGQELGRCGVCNRTLTDPESIANGIGPVCAGRF